MSNCIESKTGAYFLSQFDFAGAIAACNAAIALTQATVDNIDDHICRAYAYCFAVEKNGANYDIGHKKPSYTAGTLCAIKIKKFRKMKGGGIHAAVTEPKISSLF